MASSLGSLTVDIRTNTQKFVDGMKTANKRMRRFEGSVKTASRTLLSLKAGLLGVAGVAGFGALTVAALRSGDAMAKTSDKLGITTEALGGLRHAAELSGVASNTLDMAIQRMTRRLSEAALGTGEAQGAIKELGLDAQALASASPDEAFRQIAGAMEGVTNQSDRVRLSFKLFDSEGVALVNTLAMGEEGLHAAAIEAQQLGIAISRVDAAKMEMANDQMTRAGAVAKGLGNAIAVNVAPYIDALARQFVDAAKESGGMSNFVAKAMENVVGVVGFAADAVRGLQVVWKGVQVVALGAISAIITSLDELNKSGAAALNWIPGINITPSSELSQWAEDSRLALAGTIDEMARLAESPKPSEGIKKGLTELQYQSRVTAEAIADARKKIAEDGDGQGGGIDVTKQQTALANLKNHLSQRVAAITTSTMTEQERLREAYNARQLIIEEAFQRELIGEQRRTALLKQIDQKYAKDKLDIQRKSRDANLSVTQSLFGSLATLVKQGGKKTFAVWKSLAVAETLISTYSAAQKAFESQIIPGDPTSLARGYTAAAAAVASGLARLASIKSATASGGGGSGGGGSAGGSSGAGSVAGGEALPPLPTDVQRDRTPPQININFHGSVVGSEGITQAVADAVKEASEYEYFNLEVVGTGQRVRAR